MEPAATKATTTTPTTPTTPRDRPGEPELLERARTLVGHGLRAAEAYGRPDLAERLRPVARRLDQPEAWVVVAGAYKQGKSALVNALVGAEVCPVDDTAATAVPTFVRFGPQRLAFAAVDAEGGPEGEPRLEVREVPLDAIPRLVLEGGEATDPPVRAVHLTVPSPLLAGGLVLVDTPAVGGLASATGAAVLHAATAADAVVLVSDASQELTRAEVDVLDVLRARCPVVLLALTKTDFSPWWRQILELDAGHLRRAGGDVPVFPLGAPLRHRALATGDRVLDEESGFPALEAALTELVTTGDAHRRALVAAAHVLAVCRQLTEALTAERTALTAGDGGAAASAELAEARERAEQLRSAGAKWHQTLVDGMADLLSDLEHDLRARIRRLVKEADEAIEHADPADTWPEFASWLDTRAGQDGLAVLSALHERLEQLNSQVLAHFQEAAGPTLGDLAERCADGLLHEGRLPERFEDGRFGVGKQAMVVARGAYGGLAMFSMLFSMAGIALGPVGLGIGLAMGHKGLREEKARRLAQRRAQARNEVRRYCDEVHVALGKELRDTARQAQRRLRDHYATLAEEQQRSVAAALARADEAARTARAHRDQRVRDLDAELGRVATLARLASELAEAADDGGDR